MGIGFNRIIDDISNCVGVGRVKPAPYIDRTGVYQVLATQVAPALRYRQTTNRLRYKIH